MKRKRNADTPYARLDPSTRGVICGMYLAKATREDILKHVVKQGGTTPSPTAIDDVIKRKKENPEWKGEGSDLVGRPSLLTDKQREKVVRLVFKERGAAKVTTVVGIVFGTVVGKFPQSSVQSSVQWSVNFPGKCTVVVK